VRSLLAYLRRDGLLLLGALLLAVLVWSYANDELTEVRQYQVRLDLRVPPGLTVVSGAVASVQVRLHGPRGRMAGVDQRTISAHYDLPDDAAGFVLVALTEKNFVLPAGLQLSELPEPFGLTVERLAQARVKVLVRTEGQPAEGHVVREAPRAEPAEVLVRGRQEKIEELEHLFTEPVSIAGRREWQPAYFNLSLEDGLYCSERVLVLMRIGAAHVPRDVSNIVVRLLMPPGFARNVEIETPAVTLRLQGEPKAITALEARSVMVMVDVSGLAAAETGGYELPAMLQLPAGISLAPGVSPPKVRVQLK
jgi:hypothetical protein